MNSNDFNKCLKEIKSGNLKPLEKIYIEYYAKMTGAAYLIVKDKQLALDAASEVMLNLTSYNLSEVISPNSYMFQAAQNAAKKLLKSKFEVSLENNILENMIAPLPFSKIEFKDLISCLNELESKIIVLRYVWSYKINEIAQGLFLNENTVKSHIKRAKVKLKKIL